MRLFIETGFKDCFTYQCVSFFSDQCMEELKSFFASKGLEAKDIPKGIVVHEILGLGILLSAWAGCYITRPTATILTISKSNLWLKTNAIGSSNKWQAAQEKARKSKLVSLVNSSKYLSNLKAQQVTVSFAESYLIRKLLMPLLIPLKFWLAFKIVMLSKNT